MYAQFDENGICIAVTERPVTGVKGVYATLENLGQKWDGESEEWEAIPETPEEQALTNEQVVMLALADIFEEIQILKEGLANG